MSATDETKKPTKKKPTEKQEPKAPKSAKASAAAKKPAIEVKAPRGTRAAAKEAPTAPVKAVTVKVEKAKKVEKKAVKPVEKVEATAVSKKPVKPKVAKKPAKAADLKPAIAQAPAKPPTPRAVRAARKAEPIPEAEPKTVASRKKTSPPKSRGRKAMSEIEPIPAVEAPPAEEIESDVSVVTDTPVAPFTLLSQEDLWLFNSGRNFRLYEKLGSHLGTAPDGTPGTYFSVWAPDAERVSLIGDWNHWQAEVTPLSRLGDSGVWSAFVPGVEAGARYKYRVESRFADYRADKADPFAVTAQVPPEQASIVSGLAYDWQDGEWMAGRKVNNALDAPISIYELHLGSWRRQVTEEGGEPVPMSYRELAPVLAQYVFEMGYTHVELLPVMEHPFYGSWGYQVTGFFATTSRYGTPQDLMFLIDTLHQNGIGVLLDWVPSHFPTDEFALGYFDGTYLYEHADPRQGFHPDWGSLIFNYGRHEVLSFLVSSALFWLEFFHADGLRVDAVASMLYRDYSRGEGGWVPNIHGGRENLEAIDFLHTLNREIAERFPDTLCVAEESTAWPLVSRPVDEGGLGFDMKWDMGWMHDTLKYFALDPLARSHHHGLLTFRAMYAGSENFVLPLSHDEVVHMKGSLIGKMPGDLWQRFANLRLLFAYMLATPGKKLLFMGGEIGQWREWNHDTALDWHLLDDPQHAGLHAFVRDANHLYLEEPALYELDAKPAEGFEWLDCNDALRSVIAILRKPADPEDEPVAIVLNFTPVPREGYAIGLPAGGVWREILNSDSLLYGGTGAGNPDGVQAEEEPLGTWDWSARLTLPPLAAVVLKRDPTIEPVGKALAVMEEDEPEEEPVAIAALADDSQELEMEPTSV